MVGSLPTAIVNGKRFNFFQLASTSNVSFPSNPDVMINFKSANQFLRFDIVSGAGTISYSFDGTNVDGILTPSTTYNTLSFTHRNNKLIWLSTNSGTSVLRVEAYAMG